MTLAYAARLRGAASAQHRVRRGAGAGVGGGQCAPGPFRLLCPLALCPCPASLTSCSSRDCPTLPDQSGHGCLLGCRAPIPHLLRNLAGPPRSLFIPSKENLVWKSPLPSALASA